MQTLVMNIPNANQSVGYVNDAMHHSRETDKSRKKETQQRERETQERESLPSRKRSRAPNRTEWSFWCVAAPREPLDHRFKIAEKPISDVDIFINSLSTRLIQSTYCINEM